MFLYKKTISGTVICPGIGTAVGAAAGAIGGTAGGAALGKLTGKVVTGVRKMGSGALRTVTGTDKKAAKTQVFLIFELYFFYFCARMIKLS